MRQLRVRRLSRHLRLFALSRASLLVGTALAPASGLAG